MSANLSTIPTPYSHELSNRADEIVKILGKTFSAQAVIVLTFETPSTPAKVISRYSDDSDNTESASHEAVKEFCDRMKLARSAQSITSKHPTKHNSILLAIAGAPIVHPDGHICGAVCIFNGSSTETDEKTRYILEKFSTILSSSLSVRSGDTLLNY